MHARHKYRCSIRKAFIHLYNLLFTIKNDRLWNLARFKKLLSQLLNSEKTVTVLNFTSSDALKKLAQAAL